MVFDGIVQVNVPFKCPSPLDSRAATDRVELRPDPQPGATKPLLPSSPGVDDLPPPQPGAPSIQS